MIKKYIIPIAGLLIIIFLFVAFFWKEHLSTQVPINAEKFSAFGSMIASLLTAFTVYLLYRQINEQINDRKASNLPDLYPAQISLETHDTTVKYDERFGGSYTYPQFFRTNNPDLDVKQSSPRIFCSLHNIGLGAAKEIQVDWRYSIDEVEKYIDKVYIMKYEHEDQVYDFLAPSNYIEIELPEAFMRCCGIQLNKRDIENSSTISDKKPKLGLTISFLDIHNNQIVKKFTVSFLCIYSHIYITFRQEKIKK